MIAYYKLVGIIKTVDGNQIKTTAFVTSLSGKNTKVIIPPGLTDNINKIKMHIENTNPLMKNNLEVAKNILALYQETENERPPH